MKHLKTSKAVIRKTNIAMAKRKKNIKETNNGMIEHYTDN
jgi:hypothetical protein